MTALFAERYQLIERLGRGGMGDVWLAEQHGLRGFRRRAVIKRIHAHLADNTDFVASFEDEARLAAQLDHPHIARVEDFGETDGTLYLVMEYVQGWDLKALGQLGEGLGTGVPTPLILKVIAETARALHYAHEVTDLDGQALKVVHRDVSPHNIMVTPLGATKLLDFGVARSTGQRQSTRAGLVKGKLSYLSPEQVRSQPLDGRSDLFCLGIVFWELVTRRRLFKGTSELEILKRISKAVIPDRDLKADCPPSVAPLLHRVLQRSPEDRFATGLAFAEAIEGVLAELGGVPSARQCSEWIGQLETTTEVELPGHAEPTAPPARDGEVTINLSSLDLVETQRRSEPPPLPAPGSDSNSWSHGSTAFTGPIDISQSNLPRHMTRFIGRDAEVARLHELIASDQQLVTLLGPGGMGKSRLAIHYASKHLDLFEGGAWFVDLSATTDLEGILAATGAVLNVPLADEESGAAIERLGMAMAGRNQVLMIFDNFEQVAGLAESCFTVWLRLAPQARFIVTSQRRLGLRAEGVFELDPLSGSHGLALFVACARKVRKGFKLQADEHELVEEIVRRLDGIPLALELAAARTSVLSPKKLLDRLSKRFSLLQSRDQDLSDRQRTLSSAIEWSWGLLEPWEQDALAQCSVFRGGFLLEAAEEVIDLSDYPDAPMVMDVITDLKDKSLLRSWELPELRDELRFGMYESIRVFATAKRNARPNPQAIIDRHAAYVVAHALDQVSELDGAESHRAMTALAAELENLLSVAERCADERGVEAILAAGYVLDKQGPFTRAHDLLDRSVTIAHGVSERTYLVKALLARCRHYLQLSAFDDVARDASEGLALADALGEQASVVEFRRLLGELHMKTGNFEEAEHYLTQALELSQTLGDRTREVDVLYALGNLAFTQGDLSAAQRRFERYQSLTASHGLEVRTARVGNVLGWLMQRLGRNQEAEQLYRDTLDAAERFKDIGLQASVGGNLGALLLQLSRLDEAAEAYELALERSLRLGKKQLAVTIQINMAILELSRDDLGRAKAVLDAIQGADDPRMIGWASALQSLVAGAMGELAQATEHHERSQEITAYAREPIAIAFTTICSAGLDLAQAEQGLAASAWGQVAQAIGAIEDKIASVRTPLTAPDGSTQRSAAEQEGDIRVVIRLLEQRLEALRAQLETSA